MYQHTKTYRHKFTVENAKGSVIIHHKLNSLNCVVGVFNTDFKHYWGDIIYHDPNTIELFYGGNAYSYKIPRFKHIPFIKKTINISEKLITGTFIVTVIA